MIRKLSLVFIVPIMAMISCQQGMKHSGEAGQENDPRRAEVIEVIHTTTYTYLKVEKNRQEQWIAILKQEVLPGDVIYYEEGLEMKNFESPELGRTFESVYFVDEISNQPLGQADPHAGMTGDQPMKPVIEKQDIKVDQPEGGISIAELYRNRGQYSGKTVKVRGKVTKVNAGIMDRNWVHIQDGTADGDNYDLTLTTDDEPHVGDVVTYSGTVRLEKDFGYGYYYEVLVEDAVPMVQR